MKKTLLLISLFLFAFIAKTQAQLPENPQDISPLLIGENVPDVMLSTIDGSEQLLSALRGEKPSVLIFYRGSWCPVCNKHLAEIATVEDEILNLGYELLAISTDSPENMQQSIDKHNMKYKLLSDAKGTLAKAMGIAYQAPENYIDMLNGSSGGLNEGFLPVPSLFVVSTEGEILFEYINPTIASRIDADLLISVLESLNKTK